ncbi:hypothetical protein FRB95_005836, partial [Tulasnella sp. JGI-2019a]
MHPIYFLCPLQLLPVAWSAPLQPAGTVSHIQALDRRGKPAASNTVTDQNGAQGFLVTSETKHDGAAALHHAAAKNTPSSTLTITNETKSAMENSHWKTPLGTDYRIDPNGPLAGITE